MCFRSGRLGHDVGLRCRITIGIFGSAGQIPKHTGEYELMERIDSVPIQQPGESQGVENRRLANRTSLLGRIDLEFQPCPPWQLHFSLQTQSMVWLENFNTPEIERLAHMQIVWITPAAAYTDSTDE